MNRPVPARAGRAPRALVLVAFTLLVAMLAGCAGKSPTAPRSTAPGGGAPGGGPGGGGTPISPAALQATTDSTEILLASLVATEPDRASRDRQIAAFLRRQPTVDSADVGNPGVVWAKLKNRRTYVVFDERDEPDSLIGGTPLRMTPRPARSSSSRVGRSSVRGGAPRTSGGGPPVIPTSRQARVLSAMSAAVFGDANPEIADQLQRRGYDVIAQRATVENLHSVTGDGVFLIDTHGGAWQYKNDPKIQWSLWTDTKRSDALDAVYQQDLSDGTLGYSSAIAGKDASGKDFAETHYEIGDEFVHKYGWSFAPGALVYLNCCYGSYPGGAADHLCSLPEPAASAVGWTYPVAGRSNPTALYVFSRSLAIPSSMLSVSPAQRPWDSGPITDWLVSNGWNVDNTTSGPAYLVFIGAPFILTPSIRNLEVHERIAESPLVGSSKLVLHGVFGSQPGTVRIGGKEVPIEEWKPDQVTVIPGDRPGDPGYSGDVEVTVDGHDSNAVPLTSWHGTATYQIDVLPAPQKVQCTIAMDVTFRADVHAWRVAPEGDFDPTAVTFRASQGSTAHWSNAGAPPPGTNWVKPTSADLPFGLNGTVNPPYGNGFIFSGYLDREGGAAKLSFSFLGCVTAFDAPPAPSTDIAPLHDLALTAIASGVGTDGYPIYSNNLATTFSSSDLLLAGKTVPGSSPAALEASFVLGDFVPTFAPDPDRGEDMDPH